MSILVVDDNKMLLSKIVKSLVRANHQVRSASCLKEARSMLTEALPSAVCLDLQLTDGSGFELLDELHRDHPALPVIIISGHHSDDNQQLALSLGAVGFLSKPFSLSSLHQLLDSVLPASSVDTDLEAISADLTSTANTAPCFRRTSLSAERVSKAKRSFSTRRVDLLQASQLITSDYRPQAGDLVLAKVDKLNQHKRLELPTGRRAVLFPGDEIIVAYGHRYAPDQFEAEVPEDLSPCNLVAAGGIASQCLSRNSKMRAATRITPIGVLARRCGQPLNLQQFALEAPLPAVKRPSVTAVIGTSMNAGKTTTVAGLALGLVQQGLRVGTAKVTGTGSGGDIWQMTDAGCSTVLDFTDCGMASTYKLPVRDCERIMETLVATLSAQGMDTILIEIADGVLQDETRNLVLSPTFRRLVDRVVFAAGDAMGALSGVTWLQQQGLNVVGASGAFTAAPLAVREAKPLLDVPVLTLETLHAGHWYKQQLDQHAQAQEFAGNTDARIAG